MSVKNVAIGSECFDFEVKRTQDNDYQIKVSGGTNEWKVLTDTNAKIEF